MSEKTAAETAAQDEKLSAEQEHNRIVGCLLSGQNPDAEGEGSE